MSYKDLDNLDALLPSELEYQQSRLKALGVDEVKIGLEVEVPVRPNSLDMRYNAMMQERKAEMLAAAKTDADRARISSLNTAMEVFYEDVMSAMPNGVLIEPTIGRIEDNPGVVEFRSNVMDPQQAVDMHRKLKNLIDEKLEYYGLDDRVALSPVSTHLNFSFYKDGKNLVNPLNESFNTQGVALMRGITRAAYDSQPMYTSWEYTTTPSVFSKNWPPVDAGPSRMRTIRLSGAGDEQSRIQFMLPPEKDQNVGHPISDVLAGAIVALDPQQAEYMNKHVLPAVSVKRPFMRYKTDDDYTIGYVNHLINGSTIGDNGFLKPYKPYIAAEAPYFAEALGLTVVSNERALVDKIASVISQTKIEGQPPRIIWPGRLLKADTIAKLQRSTEVGIVVDSAETSGYDLNTPKAKDSDQAAERILRMRKSPLLDAGHSAPYRDEQKSLMTGVVISPETERHYEAKEAAVSAPQAAVRRGWW